LLAAIACLNIGSFKQIPTVVLSDFDSSFSFDLLSRQDAAEDYWLYQRNLKNAN
jgi:hypothetical protein